MNNQDRRFKKTENSIQKALVTLLQKGDLASVSFQDVIEEADINKSTFYLHYSSLGDAFAALENKCLATIFQVLNGEESSPKDIFEQLLQAILDDKKLYLAVMTSCTNSFMDKLANVALPLLGEKEANLRNAKYESGVAKTQGLVVGLYSIFRFWILSSCRAPKEKVEGDALDFLSKYQSDFSKR